MHFQNAGLDVAAVLHLLRLPELLLQAIHGRRVLTRLVEIGDIVLEDLLFAEWFGSRPLSLPQWTRGAGGIPIDLRFQQVQRRLAAVVAPERSGPGAGHVQSLLRIGLGDVVERLQLAQLLSGQFFLGNGP